MVREDQVEPAAMDLEGRAEDVLRHRRALDVPAGPPPPPRRVPPGVLGRRLVRLPQCEVARVLLERARLLALLDLVGLLAREPAVVGEARNPEIDIASGCVGVPGLDQLLDEVDDLGHALGCPWADGRACRARGRSCRRGTTPSRARELGARARRRVVDLVVDVRDVVHELRVVARRSQP